MAALFVGANSVRLPLQLALANQRRANTRQPADTNAALPPPQTGFWQAVWALGPQGRSAQGLAAPQTLFCLLLQALLFNAC